MITTQNSSYGLAFYRVGFIRFQLLSTYPIRYVSTNLVKNSPVGWVGLPLNVRRQSGGRADGPEEPLQRLVVLGLPGVFAGDDRRPALRKHRLVRAIAGEHEKGCISLAEEQKKYR